MAVVRLIAVLSTLAFLVNVCQSCSPPDGWRPSTLVDKMLESQSVLYGLVRQTHPDERFRYGDKPSTVYAVELEVYCILKGPTTPLVVNITGGGYTPGHCDSSTFIPGHAYIVTAYNNAEREDKQPLELSVAMTDINATQENLNEIRKACGLNPVTRPEGSSSSIECPMSGTGCQSTPTPLRPFGPVFVEKDGDESNPDEQESVQKPHEQSTAAPAAIFTVATTLAVTAAATLAIVGV